MSKKCLACWKTLSPCLRKKKLGYIPTESWLLVRVENGRQLVACAKPSPVIESQKVTVTTLRVINMQVDGTTCFGWYSENGLPVHYVPLPYFMECSICSFAWVHRGAWWRRLRPPKVCRQFFCRHISWPKPVGQTSSSMAIGESWKFNVGRVHAPYIWTCYMLHSSI